MALVMGSELGANEGEDSDASSLQSKSTLETGLVSHLHVQTVEDLLALIVLEFLLGLSALASILCKELSSQSGIVACSKTRRSSNPNERLICKLLLIRVLLASFSRRILLFRNQIRLGLASVVREVLGCDLLTRFSRHAAHNCDSSEHSRCVFHICFLNL